MKIFILKLNELECIDERLLDNVLTELSEYLGIRFECIPKKFQLPNNTYNKTRMQYDANEILNYIRRTIDTKGNKIIATICDDIYVEGTNFIFGLAEINGNYCILSLKRLRNEDLKIFKERIFKEMLHELGHCFGLRHCSNDCAMKFSNSIFEVDMKNKYLCEKCFRYIKLKLENLKKKI